MFPLAFWRKRAVEMDRPFSTKSRSRRDGVRNRGRLVSCTVSRAGTAAAAVRSAANPGGVKKSKRAAQNRIHKSPCQGRRGIHGPERRPCRSWQAIRPAEHLNLLPTPSTRPGNWTAWTPSRARWGSALAVLHLDRSGSNWIEARPAQCIAGQRPSGVDWLANEHGSGGGFRRGRARCFVSGGARQSQRAVRIPIYKGIYQEEDTCRS
jgi:hypothetical protein